MEFVTRPGEIVSLEDGKLYQIFQQVEYDSRAYVVLRIVPETAEDTYNFEKNKFMYAEEVIQDDNFYLVPVDDKELIEKLSTLK